MVKVSVVGSCFAVGLVLFGCTGALDEAEPGATAAVDESNGPNGEPPGKYFEASEARMHRLTFDEYRNTLTDLLPAGTTISRDLEVDTKVHGFSTIAASELTIPPLAAEQYETAAMAAADSLFSDPQRREAFVGCAPSSGADPCVKTWVETFGQQVFRRSLTEEEVNRLFELSAELGKKLVDPWAGPKWALVAMLQAPDFLFRIEVGEPDPQNPRRYRFTSVEMASRLSYAIWRSAPDDALLQRGLSGELTTVAALAEETERMMADDKAKRGLASFFSEFASLDRLALSSKNAELYPEYNKTLRAAMKAEVEALFLSKALDPRADLREIYNTNATFLTPELAALYGVAEDATHLPTEQERGGLLGRAGPLSTWAHDTLTSPTRRGRFVRTDLLCEDVSPPPPGVDTTLEENHSEGSMRERLSSHATNPQCAGCHVLMDPIGFALERFGPIGEYRDDDHGHAIDTATEVNGVAVADAVELGELLAQEEKVSECMARRYFRFAMGHLEEPGEEISVLASVDAAVASGHTFSSLLSAVVTSDAFRYMDLPEQGDARCFAGETKPCDNACGAGEQVCESGIWSECRSETTTESCNGLDDDCDEKVDEGLSGQAEICNGRDDNCDGTIDEGLSAEVVSSTFSTLVTHHELCNGSTQRRGVNCNSAIHRMCSKRACSQGGFGPIENGGDAAAVTCVEGSTQGVPFATLAAIHPQCNGSTEVMGLYCNSAIHRHCANTGEVTGFGPVELGPGTAHITCVPKAVVKQTTYTALAAHHGGCTQGERIGPSCDAAIHRFCTGQGFTSGFGPVESSGDTAVVSCVGGK